EPRPAKPHPRESLAGVSPLKAKPHVVHAQRPVNRLLFVNRFFLSSRLFHPASHHSHQVNQANPRPLRS
ncbi:hypothetical protein FRC11_002242, partial [Ceratobasidium sp. 423]